MKVDLLPLIENPTGEENIIVAPGGVGARRVKVSAIVDAITAQAEQARDEANAGKEQLLQAAATLTAALGSASIPGVFASKALLVSNIGSVAANAFALVVIDETKGNDSSIYQKVAGSPVYVGSANGWASSYAVADNGAISQNQMVWSPAQSAANSEGGFDNVDLTLQTTKNYIPDFGDGTSGTDYVFGLGWNLNSAFTSARAGLPAFSYRIESKWRYNRLGHWVTQGEIHVGATWTGDAVGAVEFRPITIGAPHFKADWAEHSSILFQTAYISIQDGAETPVEWLTFDARASNGGTRYINAHSAVWRETTNDLPIFRQFNAAGTAFLNLPFINSSDETQIDRPIAPGVRFSGLAAADYANDAAAAASGVPVGGFYHTGGVVKVRRS